MKAETLAKPTKSALLVIAGLAVVIFGVSLRLDSLGERPMHADEATGARILANRLETGSYAFDPAHFHGPLLTAMAEPVARSRSETTWQDLTPGTVRLLTAAAGGLTVLLVLAFAPWLGLGALFAAAFIATSPFLVYYSRMFIHEPLFGFLAIGTILALFAWFSRPALWTATIVGLAAGLLMATRETFVICFFAWAVAGAAIGFELHRRNRLFLKTENPQGLARHVIAGCVVALAVTAGFYTDWGSRPAGMLDLARTFFVYETGEGHDKPFLFYSWMLIWPKFQGGVWWSEGGIFLAAIAGAALSFRHPNGHWVRFLFYAAIIQWVVYSLIPYKTPWLMTVAWLHLCLAAGAGIASLARMRPMPLKVAAVALFAGLIWWQHLQADRAVHRYASDARNPYAYVPTSLDAQRMGIFIIDLAELFPEVKAGPVAVIGNQYWPLPWYLRELPAAGYWRTLPEESAGFPVLIVMPGLLEAAGEKLEETHVSLPRGLRSNTPVFLFIRNDIWNAFLEIDD